jgi:hypothetical protein
MEMFKNSGSSCLDVTYKENNIYMNTIKYNSIITSTADVIMGENVKLLKDNPDILFLINSSINKSYYVNNDPRINNSCLWFNVIKTMNVESGYEVTYDDIRNFRDVINFNGHVYKIAHCMIFDGTNPRFKIMNYKDSVKYLYSDYIQSKDELLKVFKGENQEKFSIVDGKIETGDPESYVPVYIRITPKYSSGAPAATPMATTGNFNFPAKPMTFGTPAATPVTTTGSFNFPAKPMTFGTPVATPATTTGSFNFPAKPMTFGTPVATPASTSGSFNFPAKPMTFETPAATTAFNFQAKPMTFGTPAATPAFNFQAKPMTFGTPVATPAFNFQAKPMTFGTPAANSTFQSKTQVSSTINKSVKPIKKKKKIIKRTIKKAKVYKVKIIKKK